MANLSKKTQEYIYSYVKNDLEPRQLDVALRIGVTLLLGGILSMFFCGQFGIGFSSLAKGWNHALHAHMGATQCAIVCGAIFSVVPVLFLRFVTNGVLFRKIIRHYTIIQAGMMFLSGSSMYLGGVVMNELINVSVWSISAFISFKIVGLIVDEISVYKKSAPLFKY